MGKARLILLAATCCAAAAGVSPGRAAEARARFISYPNEAECLADHILPAATCRSAFANARQKFDQVTTAYPTLSQCTKASGRCVSAGRNAGFRPAWRGIDVVQTPGEQSVTPTGNSRQLRFAALPLNGPLAPPRELTVRRKAALVPEGPARPIRPGEKPSEPAAATSTARRPEPEAGPSEAPPPGSGFKLEDGVLTYPAPSRFQPRNLPRQP